MDKQAALPEAIVGGLAGAGLGGLGSVLVSMLQKKKRERTLQHVLAMLAGGGLGALSGYYWPEDDTPLREAHPPPQPEFDKLKDISDTATRTAPLGGKVTPVPGVEPGELDVFGPAAKPAAKPGVARNVQPPGVSPTDETDYSKGDPQRSARTLARAAPAAAAGAAAGAAATKGKPAPKAIPAAKKETAAAPGEEVEKKREQPKTAPKGGGKQTPTGTKTQGPEAPGLGELYGKELKKQYVDPVKQYGRDVSSGVSALGEDLKKTYVDPAVQAARDAKDYVVNSNLGQNVGAATELAGNLASDAGSAIKDTASKGLDWAHKNISDPVAEAAKTSRKAVKQYGRDFSSGVDALGEDINKTYLQPPLRAAGRAVDSVKRIANKLLKNKTVQEGVGGAKALGEGIGSAAKDVGKGVSDAARTAVKGVKTYGRQTAGGVKALGEDINKTYVQPATKAIKQYGKGAAGGVKYIGEGLGAAGKAIKSVTHPKQAPMGGKYETPEQYKAKQPWLIRALWPRPQHPSKQ